MMMNTIDRIERFTKATEDGNRKLMSIESLINIKDIRCGYKGCKNANKLNKTNQRKYN